MKLQLQKMTWRGQSFPQKRALRKKLQKYITARWPKLRLLTAKSKQIDHLMEDDWWQFDTYLIQKEIKSYKSFYEEFIELNQSVKLYLKEEENKADQMLWHEPKVSAFQNFMKWAVNWIEKIKLHKDLVKTSEKDITPTNSLKCVWKQKSDKSSPAMCLKEEANRAAFMAKAAPLKETQTRNSWRFKQSWHFMWHDSKYILNMNHLNNSLTVIVKSAGQRWRSTHVWGITIQTGIPRLANAFS